MAKLLRRCRNFLLDLLFPLECLICGQDASYLCPKCFQKIEMASPEAAELSSTNFAPIPLSKIYVAGNYEDKILNKLIIKYKYNFISPLGKILADFLIIFWNNLKPSYRNIIVIPVPLSAQRQRWRGFNQAEIIARGFSESFGYAFSLDLKRIKHRPPQAGLNENERSKNIRAVFSWTGSSLSEKTIILIDDVATTGATLSEAAKALKNAGAAEIIGLVLAKG